MLPDDLQAACFRLRREQLESLRHLVRINFILLKPGKKFVYTEIQDLLDRFSSDVAHLRSLEQTVASYKEQGISDAETIPAIMVTLRWKRLNRTIPRAQRRLEAFHENMPLNAPFLRMDSEGTITRNRVS